MGFFDKISSAVSTAVTTAGKALAAANEAIAKAPPPPPQPEPSFGKKLELFATSSFETAKDYGKAIGQGVVNAPGNVADAAISAKEAVAAKINDLDRRSPPGRSLRADEIELLRTQVYGDSVDYSKVQIKENEDVLTRNISDGCPFTLGNTIYIPPGRMPLEADLLTHEMMHVWQYQNGGSEYLPKALWAQKLGDGYDFKKGIAEGKAWGELNPEQQGEFMEQANLAGAFATPDRTFVHKGTDYSEFLRKALVEIQAGRGAGDD